MPQFQYQATTPHGKIIEGVREAGEERAVVAWLHKQGYIPLSVAPPAPPGSGLRAELGVSAGFAVERPHHPA